jgi:hypothetical protein
MAPPSSFDDNLDDSLTMSQGRKRKGISLDFLIWKRKAKSIVDPDELAGLMSQYYLDEASKIDDAQAKVLTMLAIAGIDFDAIALELIETTHYEKDTKN